MEAVILAIGDELVLGQNVDTNSAWLSAQLARQGVMTLFHQTVPDNRAMIAAAIDSAAIAGELVLVTGGIGPTEDDLTRAGLADAMGEDLVTNEQSIAIIQRFFESRGKTMPERNKVQAMHPHGSELIANPNGTAPGLKATLHGATIFVMPGVPREMKPMFEANVLPFLQSESGEHGRTILTTKLNTYGLGESNVAELLGDLMDRSRNPTVGTTASAGVISVRLRSDFASAKAAHREMEKTIQLVEDRLGSLVFGRDDQTLQQAVINLAEAKDKRLATAESCTGGLVGRYLTDVPGSSSVYLGGWITYANAMKRHAFGITDQLLQQEGAVSEAVARAMAQAALEQSGADLALSVTGIAGPGGGSEDKPVGTVWFGIASQRGSNEPVVEAERHNFGGDRSVVRTRAAYYGLHLLRRTLIDMD